MPITFEYGIDYITVFDYLKNILWALYITFFIFIQ